VSAEDYRAAAEGVVTHMREQLGIELRYDKESIQWLDGYINRIRLELNKEIYAGLAAALGAYVGETIINVYGGTWAYFEKQGSWGIQLNDGNGAFPIAKVYKQLEDGEFDSVYSFFTIIPLINEIASAPPNSVVERSNE